MRREELIERLRRNRELDARGVAPPPPPERKEALVQEFRAFTEIVSQAVYRNAFPDPKGYDRIHAPAMADAELGRETREALDASRFIPPEHPEWQSLIRTLTKEEERAWHARHKALAGVRSIKALYEGAGSVSVELEDGHIETVQRRNIGDAGWRENPGLKPTILPESVSDEELGAAINAALEVSRNA